MEIFINILINSVLSVIDVYLIEFYINKSNKSIYINKNILIVYEFILILIVNIHLIPNIYINCIIYILAVYISFIRNMGKINFQTIIPYCLLMIKLFSEIFIFIIFEWILNISISITTLNWVTSYSVLSQFIFRYVEYTVILMYLNFKKDILLSIHHYKIISIFISLYFSISVIINTKRLFYFDDIGRIIIFIIIIYNFALIAFNKYQTVHEILERDMLQTNERILAEKRFIERKVEADENIKRMRHDLKNYYHILNGYANDGNIEEIKKFLETRIGILDKSSSFIHSGHSCIDSILNEKIFVMKEKNIQYTENLVNMDIGNIDVSDLSLLIGLALDNAIEAAEQVNDFKEIEFTAKNYQGYLVLYFKNSIISNSHPDFNKTSKLSDSFNHGFGVKGIKQFAKIYNGEMKYITEKDKVILRVTLSVSNG